MNTEVLYKVISASRNTVEAATEFLTKEVNKERDNGWIPLGDVVILGKARDGSFRVIQVVTNDLNSD